VAYRADIEIAVRGAQELKRLQNEVSATSKLVNQLNNYLENIGDGGVVRNINNLRDVVGKAAAAFNDAALGTDEATIAAKKYITATVSLNAGLRERAELLKQITEQERKARLAASGVRETTQYAGPIGPGQASPVALASQLRGRTEQILAERKGAKELEQALAALEEKRRLEANAMLDQKAASVALQAERKKEKFLAGATAFTEPIGPGQASPIALASQLRGRTEQILAERRGRAELNAVLQDQFEAERQLVNSKLDAKAARVQQSLDQQAAAAAESATQIKKLADRQQEFTARTEAAARAARAQTAEFIRQQRIAKQMRGLSAQAPEGGFPTAGPMLSPGFRGMQRSVGKFGENLALGAGFPLLFGGGAGSILGSIAGSFVGSGFGGQILGGAIGQVLDQALLKIRDIGTAIKELDFSSLVESGVRFTKEIQSQLDLLLQVGDAVTAQKILSQEVARETGTLPGVTEDIANSVNILNDSWRKTINAIGTTVGIIASPLAVAIAGILEVVNLIFRGVNQIFSLLSKGIKTAAEFVIQLIGGKDALDFINQGIAELNSGLSEAVATAAEFRNTLNQTVVRTSIDLAAAQALTPGLTSEDKLTNIRVEKQRQLNQLYQDEADARIKIRSENAKATQEIIDGLIKQNEFAFKNKRKLIEITAERQITTEIQREQARLAAEEARAAEKAARELERQRKEMERMAKLRAQQFIDAQRGFVLAEAGLTVTAAGEEGDEKAKIQAEFDRQRAERMFKYTELLSKALSDEERLTLIATQEIEAEKALIEVTRDLFNIDMKRAELLNSPTALAGAQQELELLAAKIQGKEQEYELQQKINDLVSQDVPLEDARGLVLTIQDLEKQNKAIEAQKQLWADIYTTVAGELQSALTGLIDGTTQWGDVLSSILGSLGNLFLSAAFTGLGGALKLPGFANGGFVTSPTTALVGEGGEPEYVIPASKMRAAMGRYAGGARGAAVIPGNGESGGGYGGGAGGGAIDVRYSIERINNVDYVTAEQFERGMTQAAQQGAVQGERRALRTLGNSPATRRRLGV
jgi:SLT domain-containing protein